MVAPGIDYVEHSYLWKILISLPQKNPGHALARDRGGNEYHLRRGESKDSERAEINASAYFDWTDTDGIPWSEIERHQLRFGVAKGNNSDGNRSEHMFAKLSKCSHLLGRAAQKKTHAIPASKSRFNLLTHSPRSQARAKS